MTKRKPGRPPKKHSPAGFIKVVQLVALVQGHRQEGVMPPNNMTRWKSEREACRKLEQQALDDGYIRRRKDGQRFDVAGGSLKKALRRNLKTLTSMQDHIAAEYRRSGIEPPKKDAAQMTDAQVDVMRRGVRAWATAEGIDLNALAGKREK